MRCGKSPSKWSRKVWGVVAALVLVAAPLRAWGAPATSAPAGGGAAGTTALKVVVDEVTGAVQVRADDKSPWQKAAVGMEVGEGAEFRTGPRSSVRCLIPPDQQFVLDRLGTVKVAQAIRDGNKVKTDMVMKYGRTKYGIEAAGLEHESTISSPSSTLAVRGTVVALYDQPPFTPVATSYTGRAFFRNANRVLSVGKKGQGTTNIQAGSTGAAETALSQTVTDPRYAFSRTSSEANYIQSEVSRGGVVSYDPFANILVIRGGTPIRDDKQLARALPGGLDIVARWFGPADVNLEAFVQFGNPDKLLASPTGFKPDEFLYPGYGMNKSKSGGVIPYDHRGGPNGGTEFAHWPTVRDGVYGIGALLVSGQPVDLKVNVFLNGQKQYLFFVDGSGNFVKSKTLELTLNSSSLIGGPIAFIPAETLLETVVPTGGNTPDDGGQATITAARPTAKRSASGGSLKTAAPAVAAAAQRKSR